MGNYTPAQERANAIADRQALVGTLASLPAHVQAVVKAYGAACARTAVDDAATLRQQAGRVDMERVAQLIAHRACCGTEADPLNGKLHGYCVVCGVPWPCEYAGKPPAALAPFTTGAGHE